MKISETAMLRLYSLTLHLYPAAFRARYGVQMTDAVRLAHAESKDDMRLAATLAWDTAMAAMREHWRAATPFSAGYAGAFALFFSALLMILAVAYQQVLRLDADRQPTHLVSAAETQLAQGQDTSTLLTAPHSEISSNIWLEGTAPFTAVYDAAGEPIAGDATLHGTLPQPPKGIFAYLREHGHHKVTWQPELGIRVALVGQHLPDGRFVLAGQSLIRSETREVQFHSLLLWIWAAMITAVFGVLGASRGRVRASRL